MMTAGSILPIHLEEFYSPLVLPNPLIQIPWSTAAALDDGLLDLSGLQPGVPLFEGFEDELLELPPMQGMGDGPVHGPGKSFEPSKGGRVHEVRIYTFSSPILN